MHGLISIGLFFLLFADEINPQKPEIKYIYIGLDGGGYEDAKITIYSDYSFSFHHSGDCCCGTYVDDEGKWRKNRKGVLLLNSFKKVKDLNCKKRKLFRNLKIDSEEDIIEVPARIYGYRTMARYFPLKDEK